MKLLLSGFIFLFSFSVIQAQEIKWMSMNDALEAQQTVPKKIFLDAYTSWCGPCKMLDRNTFTNMDVINYINKHYYPVKFNAEGDEVINYKGEKLVNTNFDPERKGRNSTHPFTVEMKVGGYPSLVFLDEEGELLAPIPGYRTPEQLEIYLKMFAQDDYKKFTTNEDFKNYAESFEGSFEN